MHNCRVREIVQKEFWMTHLHYLKGFCHNDDKSCDKELKLLERVFLQSCAENITNPCYGIWSNKNNSSDFCQPQLTYLELYVYGKISVKEKGGTKKI